MGGPTLTSQREQQVATLRELSKRAVTAFFVAVDDVAETITRAEKLGGSPSPNSKYRA